MLVIFSRAAVVMLVACATACGSLADAPLDDAGSVASAASSVILLCELDDGSYGALLTYAGIDADGDGFTVPASGQICTDGTLPPPYRAAENGLDCDDTDATVDQLLPYAGIDGDGDGFTVPASGEVCTDGTLPPPYRPAENGLDCDDADPTVDRLVVLYPDQDGDGVGATPRQILCIGATPPQGFALRGYDDDDADPLVIEADDDDIVLLEI
jgi:hypothetical protein